MSNSKVTAKRGVYMFSALDKAGNIVWITSSNVERLKRDLLGFFCPCCRSRLLIKAGKIKLPHFAHPLDADNCSQSGESEKHHLGKHALATYFQLHGCKVKMEVYFSTINRQADLVLGEHIVIEYQCSTILKQEFLKRTNDYRSQHLRVYWLLGKLPKRTSNHIQLTSFMKHFLLYHPNFGTFLPFFNTDTGEWIVFYQFLSTFSKLKYYYRKQKFLKGTSWKEIIQWIITKKKAMIYFYEGDNRVREKRIYFYTRFQKNSTFMRFLYSNGYYLQHLPAYVGVSILGQELVKEPALEWQFFLYHTFFLTIKRKEFSFESYMRIFKNVVTPVVYPMIKATSYLELGKRYMEYLIKKAYVRKTDMNKYQLISKFH